MTQDEKNNNNTQIEKETNSVFLAHCAQSVFAFVFEKPFHFDTNR